MQDALTAAETAEIAAANAEIDPEMQALPVGSAAVSGFGAGAPFSAAEDGKFATAAREDEDEQSTAFGNSGSSALQDKLREVGGMLESASRQRRWVADAYDAYDRSYGSSLGDTLQGVQGLPGMHGLTSPWRGEGIFYRSLWRGDGIFYRSPCRGDGILFPD